MILIPFFQKRKSKEEQKEINKEWQVPEKLEPRREPEIGETWIFISDDPFKESFTVKIIDKKDGYVKYRMRGRYDFSLSIDNFLYAYTPTT